MTAESSTSPIPSTSLVTFLGGDRRQALRSLVAGSIGRSTVWAASCIRPARRRPERPCSKERRSHVQSPIDLRSALFPSTEGLSRAGRLPSPLCALDRDPHVASHPPPGRSPAGRGQ